MYQPTHNLYELATLLQLQPDHLPAAHPLFFTIEDSQSGKRRVAWCFVLFFRRGVMIFSFVDHVYRVNIRTPHFA